MQINLTIPILWEQALVWQPSTVFVSQDRPSDQVLPQMLHEPNKISQKNYEMDYIRQLFYANVT